MQELLLLALLQACCCLSNPEALALPICCCSAAAIPLAPSLSQSIAKHLQEGEAGFGSFVEPELGQ